MVRTVRVICVVAGLFMVVVTATVALSSLPLPAAGGTCGPGTSSESAMAAFFDPVSIGAGTRPGPGTPAAAQWTTFVHECQTATDNRMIVVAVELAVALLILGGAPWLLRRTANVAPSDAGLPPAGWYPDPGDRARALWWDGAAWGGPGP